GYDIGIYDVVLEKLPANAGELEPEKDLDLTPRFPEPPPAVPSGTAVFRGLPLATYVDRLKNAAPADRTGLVRAIGSFGPDAKPAVSTVTSALNDRDATVRAAAAWALSQIGPAGSEGVPALANALADPSGPVRILAALALKAMGPNAAAAVP